MRTLLALLLLAAPLAARPTIAELLDAGVSDPFEVSYLPVPDLTPIELYDQQYGSALAIRGDYAFVGAPVSEDVGPVFPGSVHVYRRQGRTWSEIQQLTPPDVEVWMRFGNSVTASSDGSLLVVGSHDREQSEVSTAVTGGAYLFARNDISGRYGFLQKLTPSTAVPLDSAGSAVAISGDWIVLGAPADDDRGSNSGSAFLFQCDPATGHWTERQQLLPANLAAFDGYGAQVTIDGPNLAVWGGHDINANRYGVLYLYRLNETTGTWSEVQQLEPPNNYWSFGVSSALSGERLIASYGLARSGAPQGATYPYRLDNGSWIAEPVMDDRTDTSTNGREVTLFGDGSLALTSGADLSDANLPYLAELLRFDESSGIFKSVHIVGDILTAHPLPAFLSGFRNVLAEAVAADQSNLAVTVYATQPGTGDSFPVVAVLSASAAKVEPSHLRPLLNFADAPPATAHEAAFAYQTLLYTGTGPGYLTRHDQMDTLYGPANRANADRAEELLRLAYPVSLDPAANEFENLFLDLAYGRAGAQLILSKDTLRRLNFQRLDGSPSVPGELFIHDEIDLVQEALDQSAAGLDTYLALFQDRLGVPTIGGEPAGRAIFAEHVPDRQLLPATDEAGNPVNGSPAPLLDGYKDLVLLYDLLAHHTRTAGELAFLLTARDAAGDAPRARQLIGDVQRLVFEQRVLLDALFPALDLNERDTLGLTSLSAGIDAALSNLAAFEQNLNGSINLLGYEPDFLMLVQNQAGLFDSFDTFEALLTHTLNCTPQGNNTWLLTGDDSESPLGFAIRDRCAALNAIAGYAANQGALQDQFNAIADNSTSAIIPRLTEIVGVPPKFPSGQPDPAYQTPENNAGSEISQQLLSIEVARLRVERNGAEISNLHEKVRIEQRRRAAEAGINADLSSLIIQYGGQQASMTEEIGRIEAAQAAAEAFASLFSVETFSQGVATLINGAVQTGGEIGKANLQAEKERLAATQEAAVRDADDAILDNNSKALVKTLLLEMNTLLIDSEEAAQLLRQEAGRLTGLLAEKADLERRLAAVENQLASRYFADPIHRLRALNTTERAEISFRNARKWLFFAARALEYKWNTPFNLPDNVVAGRPWTIRDLFMLRNAAELDLFFEALASWDNTVGLNRTFTSYPDWFSLREDYFGYELSDDLTGQPLTYDAVNPATGGIEHVDALTAFRFALQGMVEDCDHDGNDEICLRFDTLRRNALDTSTAVPQFTGNLFSDVNYLDRIIDLKVFVRGPHQHLAGNDDVVNAVGAGLSYFGTSFIRNEHPGVVADPSRPDLVGGELTGYPNRFYRFNTSRGKFEFEEGLTFRSARALKILPGRTRTELESLGLPMAIDAFRERSVATTDWLLTLPLSASVEPGSRLVIDEINDIELFIRHRAVQR